MSRELRGSGNVHLRGRTWWIKYCHRGIVYRESAKSHDRNQALKLLKLRLADCARGSAIGPVAERLTIAELMTGFANAQQRAGNRTDSSATRQRWIDHFGPKTRVLDLSADRITKFAQQRLNAGLTKSTVNRDLACLRAAFRQAVKEGRLSLNHVPSMPFHREENVRAGFIEPADFARLREALPGHLQDPVAFLYYSAWRKGEMQSLEWRDVDGDVVRLRPENSKNRQGRILVLTHELLAIIQRARKNRRADCRLVFHNKGEPIGDFRKAWRNACKAAGLSAGLVIHDLRRSGVRNLVRAGTPERVAMQQSGHQTRAVFDRYNIVSEDDLRMAAERTGAYVAERSKEPGKIAKLGS